MGFRSIGREYQPGEPIVSQGDMGDCMYVIQKGQAEVIREEDGVEMRLAVLGEGDFFGEMSVFEKERRAATVRALGSVHVLTIDKKTLLRRFQKDPSLAFDIVKTLSKRIRRLDHELMESRARPPVQ